MRFEWAHIVDFLHHLPSFSSLGGNNFPQVRHDTRRRSTSWGRQVTTDGVGYSMYERASEDQEKRDQIGNVKGLIIINNQPF